MAMFLSTKWNGWNRFHRFSIPHLNSSTSSSSPTTPVGRVSSADSALSWFKTSIELQAAATTLLSLSMAVDGSPHHSVTSSDALDVSFTSSSLSAKSDDDDMDLILAVVLPDCGIDTTAQLQVKRKCKQRPDDVTSSVVSDTAIKSDSTQSTDAFSRSNTTTTMTVRDCDPASSSTNNSMDADASPSAMTVTAMLQLLTNETFSNDNDDTSFTSVTNGINRLPPEVFDIIATYSALDDVLTLAQTCKSMHTTVCNLHRPCHECGENIFGHDVEKPMECKECTTCGDGAGAALYCSDCYTTCDVCFAPCCISHRVCDHCEVVTCPDCGPGPMQTCEACNEDVCQDCEMTCACCGDVYGHDCMPFHPSCSCCELPLCGPCDMLRTVLVPVGAGFVMARLVPHDEEYEDDDDEDEYDDDDDDEEEEVEVEDDSSLEQEADTSMLRNNPFFVLGDYNDDDDLDD
jgi:hypothetical protein